MGARFALIGGLALAPHKVIRATQGIDLLTDATSAEAIHQALTGLGYQCLHRSADAANYARGDERVDYRTELKIDEVREYFRLFNREALLEEPAQVSTPTNPDPPLVFDGGLPQARTETMRDPFEALDDLMTVVEALCPQWPDRRTFSDSAEFLI